MSHTFYFKITNNTAAQDLLSIGSALKRWQIYDKETSLSFLYSEIEECWLIRVNSGCCKINNHTVHSTSENAIVVERSVDVVLNGNSFTFHNQRNAKGISKILVHSLLKRKNLKLKTENVLQIIHDNCEYYQDFYFVLDAIRKNRMFKYRCGEITLDIERLYTDLAMNRSPIMESLKYEIDYGFSKDKLKSFNISRIWNGLEFNKIDTIRKNHTVKWPSHRYLLYLLGSCSDSESLSPSKEFLPSPRSSCRYINSYQIKGTPEINDSKFRGQYSIQDNEFGSIRGNAIENSYDETSSHHSLNYDFTSFENSYDENELSIMEKRKQVNDVEKRHKYRFKLNLQPVVENINTFSDSSEHSTITHISDLTPETKYQLRDLSRGSASCIEDGFLCEKNTTAYSYVPTVKERKGHKHSSVSRYNNFHKTRKF
ncbi:uncharacterized protein VICG_00662 [Vittaforma corneae ATCC 50505]|uniref:Uncharacterized protein n=1 Tax=Vittaforma corneae (strain ATCC 50505) TaxID=993615 RepID=L2GMZ0_VITCO|nr:uncharacterized protein VICG_00662 [Vittaforma corneae ATCC 50505]ELA42263.1 hypothetical protein VICG_00662 [Vittaforma corneae ATCC 50505]